MNAALAMQDAVKCYGRTTALDRLTVAVPRGIVFGLVGHNGSGKTTSMALAAGMLGLTSGAIEVLGDGPFDPARHSGRITLLPQDSRLPPHARVAELLRYYGHLQGLRGRCLQDDVKNTLEMLNLADRSKAAIRTLSHGMMRRVTIAQALLGTPELIMLDEPFSGLDPVETNRARDIIRHHTPAQTIIISSHNLHEIEALCDEVAFVKQGRLVRQESTHHMIGRQTRLRYILQAGDLPIDALREAIPATTIAASDDGCELTVTTADETSDAADINAHVLKVLMQHSIGIYEIRRGSDLEAEYLAVADSP